MLSRGSNDRIVLVLCFELLFAPPSLQFAKVSALPQHEKKNDHPTTSSADLLIIPRVAAPPALEDFLYMQPNDKVRGRMVQVHDFIQREPSDGAPATQRTEVYLAYDSANLYAVFVCFDSDPGKIRVHLTRREQFLPDDDNVEVMLDTFHDKRRAYAFVTNPYGIQADSLWTEGRNAGDTSSTGDFGNFDSSFDTLWYSRGQLTSQGYVVWIAIPFKSLRFPQQHEQVWGIILNRGIPRVNENDFWPHISSRMEGRLPQEATLGGLEDISPGRNLQFIPYGLGRSLRSLDLRDPNVPRFSERTLQGRLGLDSKFIVKDRLVLDLTVNPDFSQIESDEPQITLNERFEVFFPEKRPFFQENANFFETPKGVLFTRRIIDPEFGARLTGKLGPYALAFLMADDRGPGKAVPPGNPLFGKRAYFFIGRVSRDIGNQSSLGVIYADREFAHVSACNEPASLQRILCGTFNRVGGVDSRFKLNSNWELQAQTLVSSSGNEDGKYLAGPGSRVILNRTGRQFNYIVSYVDNSPGFRAETGFIPRVDVRDFYQQATYLFRPEGEHLISWGPIIFTEQVWDHAGQLLDDHYALSFQWNFKRQTFINIEPFEVHNERLRPQDFNGLTSNVEFPKRFGSLAFGTQIFKQLSISGLWVRGKQIDSVPPKGQLPTLGDYDEAHLQVTLRPTKGLQIDNTYLLERLRSSWTSSSDFTSHVIRSKWNWQLTRDLSLRFIGQYNAVLTTANSSSLVPAKRFNADFLFTYLVHPGTAVYVGYNTDLSNIDRRLIPFNNSLLRSPDAFINDSRQFFVKVSYLFRF